MGQQSFRVGSERLTSTVISNGPSADRNVKDQIGDQRGVNGSLKFDLKNRREKSRLHLTRLER